MIECVLLLTRKRQLLFLCIIADLSTSLNRLITQPDRMYGLYPYTLNASISNISMQYTSIHRIGAISGRNNIRYEISDLILGLGYQYLNINIGIWYEQHCKTSQTTWQRRVRASTRALSISR